MTEQRELNSKAKPVGVQSPRFNEIEIVPRQGLALDQRVMIFGHAEHHAPLFISQYVAQSHNVTPIRPQKVEDDSGQCVVKRRIK